MFYKILPQSTQSATLFISRNSKISGLYKDGSVITLSAGNNSEKVTLHIIDDLEIDIIKVSSKVLNSLSIPEDITCQFICTNKSIRIGPIIGLLIFTNKSSITKKALRRLFDYTLLYNSIKGLLYVFSVDCIDYKTNTINGFCYNSSKHNWDEGIFPFPDAIYRRVLIPGRTLKLLQKATNKRMYNSFHFNKLDFWNMASSSEKLSGHLPITREYKSFNDINEMLKVNKVLYLKPTDSTRAFGLMRITKAGDIYSIQEKMEEKPEMFSSTEDVSRYIEAFRKGRKYLVQEGVDLLNFENRYIDFRVIMQKNHFLKWQCTGIITSIGKQGGICSNYNIDDKYMSYESFFKKYFSISESEIFQKKQEIIALCTQACELLDKSEENYADLGVDIGLDKNLKPWIFEINNRRHSHKLSLYINDYDLYYRVKSNPIIYGAKLSGFNVL